ncbi:FAD-binding domain-containing protein [Roseomonas sp. CCTCC AB2023176]|uniref:FAD-binding domain-containing protein n=1 Tax=Roseomonas sp. CCTCC AB2023176 TaxID=3342640 RepID=UPI0035DADD70
MMMDPTRAAALERLRAFAPRAGHAYATGRNTDPGPEAPGTTSALSPYVRHRLIGEWEVAGAAVDAHGARGSEKFLQEVFWRTYWKGWLEMRPAVWADARERATRDRSALATNAGLRHAFERAVTGRTGIDAFDAWAVELTERSWLHNHVRMWFASIWVFTLRLPWTLGADHFMHHLLDGDPASNTLSWRWVIGTQTRGKHYVAREENIARYTAGRFDLAGVLDEDPPPIVEDHVPDAPRPIPPADGAGKGDVGLLLHEDDLEADGLELGAARVVAVGGMSVPERRSVTGCAQPVAAFIRGAVADGIARAAERHDAPGRLLNADAVAGWAAEAGLSAVVTPWAPVGPVAEALEEVRAALAARGIALRRVRREWDEACWPLARRGYFKFRENIPDLTERLLRRPGGRG